MSRARSSVGPRVVVLLVGALLGGSPRASAQEPAAAAPAPKAADDSWGDTQTLEDVGPDAMTNYGEENTWWDVAYPVFDRTFNLLTARAARPLSFLFVVNHRTQSPLRKGPFENWLGFDSGGLKIGLGLRFGILRGLDVGLHRLNGTVESFDTYEIDARYQLLEQQHEVVDLALRAGLSWFAHQNGNQALKPFGQLLVDRVFADRVLVSAGLLLHSDSSNPVKARADTEWTFAASLAIEARIFGMLSWGLEVTTALAGYASKYPTFTTGPKLITNRHTFAVVLTNSQYILADGIITNTNREIEDLILGFTIVRELDL